MTKFLNEIPGNIKSVFEKITTKDYLKTAEVTALTALLLKASIPFDLSFSTGSQRIATSVEFSIYIKPNVTVKLSLPFEPGATLFDQ